VGNWELGHGLTAENLKALAKVLKRDSGWILTGMPHFAPIDNVKWANTKDQRSSTKGEHHGVMEVAVTASAGGGSQPFFENVTLDNGITIATEMVKGEWTFPDSYLREIGASGQRTCIIEITGDSMTKPDGSGIHSGDRVMINLDDRNPTPPGLFALWDGFGVVVKRIERVPGSEPAAIRLISDNPSHSPYERTCDEVTIIGRLQWRAHRL
jgi:phage repressor protein C with HTH and peptisase S24 domain